MDTPLRPCSRCPSHAVWQPVLGLRVSPTAKEIPARFAKLGLCEMHKDMARLGDFLSGSSWDRIARFMREAGKPAPKRNLTILRFDLIASPESTDTETLPF
jgi:hypothetical protein